jgi:hypothetical protein
LAFKTVHAAFRKSCENQHRSFLNSLFNRMKITSRERRFFFSLFLSAKKKKSLRPTNKGTEAVKSAVPLRFLTQKADNGGQPCGDTEKRFPPPARGRISLPDGQKALSAGGAFSLVPFSAVTYSALCVFPGTVYSEGCTFVHVSV